MSEMLQRKAIVSVIGLIVLATALLLTFLFHRETNADEVIGEPLDAYTKSQLQGTHLDFIAETGRIITDENGRRQIVWDPPQLPTLEESISMAAAAKEADDTSLLPFCTDEYIQYLKEQKGGGEQSSESLTDSKTPGFPVCAGIPAQVGVAPNARRAR